MLSFLARFAELMLTKKQKISFFQLLILEIHSVLESCNQIDHTHLNWYQHAKNEAMSLICSGDFIHLKILQSDCQRDFGPYLRNKIYVQKHSK